MTGMADQRDIERELGEAGLDPRIDHEHKAALHAELKARLADRKSSRPLVAVAIAVVTLGATFANQPALESTGLRLDVMQVNDDRMASLSTGREAKSAFGFSRRSTADGERVPYASAELDSLRVATEELQQLYLEGLLPLASAIGLSYAGKTEYHLAYGLDRVHTFPVSIGEIEDNEQLSAFFLSPRYREIGLAAYRGTLGPAPTDTIMLNGTPVAFSSWQFDVPEGGVITFHYGTPLN